MRFSVFTAASALLAAATAVSAETFTVLVGKGGALTYEPPSVNAKAGDIVNFQFLSKNHTVSQSTFTSPCVSKADGVDSGFQFIPAGAAQTATWSITVNNDTAPLWFYCAQGAHCKAGMVFAINPNAEKTYEAFKATAAAGGGATTGPNAANAAAAPAAGGYGAAAGAPAPGPAAAANSGASALGDNAAPSSANQEVPNFGGAASKSFSFAAAAMAVIGGIALL